MIDAKSSSLGISRKPERMTQTSNTKSVLIVDDTPTNVGVISGVLKDLYKTKVATNGEKALVLASASEKPDLRTGSPSTFRLCCSPIPESTKNRPFGP